VLQKRSRRGSQGLRGLFRRSGLDSQPRTVAQARAQKADAAALRDREAIAAQRRERRERERGAVRRTTQPARYKRKPQDTDLSQYEQRNFGVPEHPSEAHDHDHDHEHEHEAEHEHDLLDPLDAQALGLHDEAAELGHEEIRLDLGDEGEPAPAPESHPTAP
jgi:hypothetical protein